MSSPINVRRVYTSTGAQEWIPLNRWSLPDYLTNIIFNGAGDVTVEGTISQVNRGQAGEAFDITGAVNIVADAGIVIKETPLEAIRLNITTVGTDVVFHVMQQGAAT